MARARKMSQESPQVPSNYGQLTRLPLSSLRFDDQNPRVFERLGEKPSQPEIQHLLIAGDMRARDLVPSFVENGYIPYEPLVVRARGSEYIVLEGNRRLAALRSMESSDDPIEVEAFERHGLRNIPCLVFTGSDRQLLAYLGLRHLSKTKDWDTNAKAGFVERIFKSGFDLKEASRLTNTGTANLRQILLTRRLFERAGTLGLELPSSSAESETLFWHLGDAVRRKRTKSYLKLIEDPNPLNSPDVDESRFENLVTWIYGNPKTKQQRVISSIRDIADLDLALGDPRAAAALETGASLPEALEELEAAGYTAANHLERARRSIQRALKSVSDLDMQGLDQVDAAFNQLQQAAQQFSSNLTFRRQSLANSIQR